MHSGFLKNGRKLSFADIAQGMQTQLRVWNALILRETKSRYGRHKLGFFWLFIEPMFFISMFLIFKMFIRGSESSGMDDVYFIISGIAPFLLFRQTMSSLSNALGSSTSLLAFPQVTTLDVLISTVLLEFATILFVFAVVLTGAAIVHEPPNIESPLLVLYGILLLGITGTGMGLVFASLTPIWPAIKTITNPLFGRPLFFTSGIFFTAEMLPAAARDIVLYNPLLHMVEIIRSAFFIEFESRFINWDYAFFFATGLLLFGLLVHQSLKDLAVKMA